MLCLDSQKRQYFVCVCVGVVELSMTAMSQFGDIAEVIAMFDKVSNRSRGFGLVSFSDANCANYVTLTPRKPSQ